MADRIAPAGYPPTDYLKRPYKLLRQGADATITDEDGNGAFHYLVQSDMFKSPASPKGSTGIFGRRLRARSPVDDPSMTMEGLIHSLQAAGADINLQNKNGETPLNVLCRNACTDEKLDERLFERLCQAGADLNIRDRQGRSAVFSLFLTDKLNSWHRDEGEHLCQLVSRFGGRFDVQDNQGQTLIHCLLSRDRDVQLSLVEALARHGVDPSAVDDDGNTLWHAAVDRLDRVQLIDLLLRLGADPRKPNKSGRNPLHGLSSREAPYLGWCMGRMTVFPACIPAVRTTAFGHLLQLYLESGYDIDFRDNQGITSLHLTCTFSEYQVGRLLQAGADPKIPTHEGLTPFHLAARCRQANTIGMLLEKAERDEPGPDGRSSSSIHEIVNAKDASGKSALYYACASGRAESVALLLDAGASVQCDAYSGSVWQACAEFEEEQFNWSSSPPSGPTQRTASSVLIGDKTRPMPKRANKFPREHLGDVLRLLLQHQDAPGAITGYLDEAISAATEKQHEYTVWCLVEARNSLEPLTATVTVDEPTSACLARVNVLGITEAATLSLQALRAEFERLMGLRRHDLVQRLLLEHGWGELDFDGNTFIHDLVRNGFVSILRGLTPLVKELSAKLEDVEWCDRQKLASSQGSFVNRFPENIDQNFAQGSTQPLLLVACRSEEPNMEVVRFLVDEIGCGVDMQGYVRVHFPDLPTAFGICKHETPVHVLVRGRTNWWQISEALPYLARDRGANLEVRDCFRSTPLAVAVSHIGRVTFNRGAVDRLVELGADAKAVDLSWTCESAEMTDLLLSSGAVVKPAAILAAVRSMDCDVLNMLLSRGGDVNARETAVPAAHHHQNTPIYVETTALPRETMAPISEIPKRLRNDPLVKKPAPTPYMGRELTAFDMPGPPYVPEREMYPLDYAAHLFSRQPELYELLDMVQASRGHMTLNQEYARHLPAGELARVIETLIAHGADVMATYELSDGSRKSIKDRIVLRGKDIGMPWVDRPKLARRILELCKTTYEGEL
ncbi:ankyrin repeat-containing domain protein [Diaporthe sp. PMI_573]|nr:ankyrin repeat-containing domain protein [Diaporthaceae sp. PMI_573]